MNTGGKGIDSTTAVDNSTTTSSPENAPIDLDVGNKINSKEAPVDGTHLHVGDVPVTQDPNQDPGTSAISQSPGGSHPSVIQQHHGYYAYHHGSPPPNSPTVSALGTAGYEIQALLLQQQQAGGNLFGRHQYATAVPPPPLSPAQPNGNNTAVGSATNISMGVIPPASPGFPGSAAVFPGTNTEQIDSSRINNSSMVAPPSPSFQYLSGQPSPSAISGYGGVYTGYVAGSSTAYGNASPRIPNSPDQRTWSDRSSIQQQMYQTSTPAASPLMQPQGVPIQYQSGSERNRRTTSFDEMLPPSAVGEGGTLFSQQAWGYSPPGDPYSASLSPQQQHVHGSQQIAGVHRHGHGHVQHERSHQSAQNSGNPYYAATTPGPPIQTTAHNKGPDGANLFIFHIPNHFTNLDMWHLFCHYGNLLSVRIMVEKDTGRSRGFGFVSYDSPEAAAMAIKELNGFVIGNKRLKVQHKQIRPSDHLPAQQNHLQSQTLFHPSNGVHNMSSPDSTSNNCVLEVQGVSGGSWFDSHETSEGSQDPPNKEGGGILGKANQPPSFQSVSEQSPPNESEESSEIHDGMASNSEQCSNSPLTNLDQIRENLPEINK